MQQNCNSEISTGTKLRKSLYGPCSSSIIIIIIIITFESTSQELLFVSSKDEEFEYRMHIILIIMN